MIADIKDHFLATLIRNLEYIRVNIKYFPPDTIQQYYLNNKVTKSGWVCIKIKIRMPRLKQAVLLDYKHIKNSLALYSYHLI